MVKSTGMPSKVLPLENGDRLSRREFERRYQAMPQVKKAELIEGVVYMASPVRMTLHGRPHAQLMLWLGTYFAATPGTDLGDNATVRLDLDNEPQPDALLRIEDGQGGQSRIDGDGYVVGAPELIAEIAASSASIDLGDKLRVYRRNGVREYLVWRVGENGLDWWQLQAGEYVPLQPDEAGIIRSVTFPGLWLAVNELLAGEMQQVLAALQLGLNSDQHREFLAQLRQG